MQNIAKLGQDGTSGSRHGGKRPVVPNKANLPPAEPRLGAIMQHRPDAPLRETNPIPVTGPIVSNKPNSRSAGRPGTPDCAKQSQSGPAAKRRAPRRARCAKQTQLGDSLPFQVLSRRSRWPSLQTSHFTLPTGYRRYFLYKQTQFGGRQN